MKLRSPLIISLTVLLLLLSWKVNLLQFVTGSTQLWDFDVYYQTAVDVLHGAHPYQLSYMQTAGPPLVIAPFLVFSWLPLAVARSLMTVLSLVSIGGTAWLLSKTIFRKDPLPFALVLSCLLLLLFQPRFNLLLGQPNLLIMWLITMLLTSQPAAQTKNAVLLTVITLLKTHYAVAWLSLLKNYWRTVLIGAAILLVLFVTTLPVLKLRYYTDYATARFSEHMAKALVIQDVGYYNQSLRATLARLNLADTFLFFTICILLVGGWYVLSSNDLAAGFLLSLLISPIVWQHYMVITYPILFVTLLRYAKNKQLPWHLVGATLLLTAHLPWLHEQPVSLFTGLAASHYYFGVLLLFTSRMLLHTSRPAIAKQA